MGSMFWFIATIAFIVLELISTALISIWFALSAFIVFIITYFMSNTLIEIIIFCILSIIFLLLTRPIYNKYFKKKIVNTNVYSIIGKEFILKESITKDSLGKIKIDDQIWNVISNSGDIKAGEKVIVEDINGTKLVVRKRD